VVATKQAVEEVLTWMAAVVWQSAAGLTAEKVQMWRTMPAGFLTAA
jgi:hypothetical protein